MTVDHTKLKHDSGGKSRLTAARPQNFLFFAFFQNYFCFFDLKKTRLSVIFYIFGI